MQTSPWAVLCFLAAALAGALGQYLYKAGAEQATGTVVSYLTSGRLWAGVVCYIAVMVLFVAAFKFGGALSVLYPVYASTFIWAALIARYWLKEPIHLVNVAGMVVLVIGMWLMGIKP